MNNPLRFAVGNLGLVAMLQAGGIVSDCNESSLLAALVGGGQVGFNWDGIIQLSHPLLITVDTPLDATSHKVSRADRRAIGFAKCAPEPCSAW